ncbi:hypothetical protein AB7004_22110, partial [Escherichia coli]
SLKTSIKTITYLSDIGCLEIQGASLENVSLGTVNKSKVPLGLSATYGQTGNKVSAGTVQSVIGVTFIYE